MVNAFGRAEPIPSDECSVTEAMRDAVVCLLQASSTLERALIHDHPPLGQDAVATGAEPVRAQWILFRECIATAAAMAVVTGLQAGIFGRFTSPIWAYLAFGSLYYLIEESVMSFPTTAEMYFLPVVFIIAGALGLLVSAFFQPEKCEIPFPSLAAGRLDAGPSARRPGTYEEWRAWHLRLGAAERLNPKEPHGGHGWEPRADSEARTESESAKVGQGMGTFFALLSGVGICLAQIGIVRGFTAARRGLGMYNGMIAINVALFAAYFGRTEAMEEREKQGTAIILVGFVFIGCGTAHPGSIPWAAWNGVFMGISFICLRLAASATTRAFFYFLPFLAVGVYQVFIGGHGLPEWDVQFALLAVAAACATVLGILAAVTGFSRCRPFAGVAIVGSFSTLYIAVHSFVDGHLPSLMLGFGLIVWVVGLLLLCKSKDSKPPSPLHAEEPRAVDA